MKSHDAKMEHKKEHEQELDRNDLNAWFQKTWARIKSGELISSKFALIALLAGAAIGLGIYLLRSSGSSEVAAWRSLENTTGTEKLSEFAKAAPNTMPGKAALLQVARQQLVPQGTAQLSNISPDTREKAIKSIEEARENFTKLIDEFKNDLTLQAQAIDGAASAELALVGIPKAGTSLASADYRGSPEKAAELFRRYAKLVGESTKAGEAANKTAEVLETKKAEVLQLGTYLNTKLAPTLPQPEIKIPPSLTPEAKKPDDKKTEEKK